MLDRIQVDAHVCGGKATIRGMRVTVDFVLKLLGDGYGAAQIVAEYPELEEEDVFQAAKYGAWLAGDASAAEPLSSPESGSVEPDPRFVWRHGFLIFGGDLSPNEVPDHRDLREERIALMPRRQTDVRRKA